ncbi:protein TIFY 6b [Canna indica]|uniref:Protein TIFY n=1 Tax=Canna indica TaxID=4628 RepID=A0AAQ3L3B8_9LILI|nr:protein TIFY 6b [Canna indica]
MERDFLGIHRRDSGDDARRSIQDAALSGNSEVLWPFSKKFSSMQQFMFYKAAQEEKQRNHVFDNHSSSRFHPISSMDAFEAHPKNLHRLATQEYSSLNKQGFNQYFLHAYQSQCHASFDASYHLFNDARTFPVFSHDKVPVSMSSPFYNVQNSHCGSNMRIASPKQPVFGNGNAVNSPVAAPRNMPKPTNMTAQLTIFFAGCVNVYDDVPFDKVQEIMSLASKGSDATSHAMNSRSEAPLPTTEMVPTKVAGSNGLNAKQQISVPRPIQVVSPCSGRSSPISISSHMVVSSGSGLRTSGDTTGSKATSPLARTSQQENPKTSTAALNFETDATGIPKAVPQARKASLARFLEKRKERLTFVMPYSCSKINLENASGLESCNVSSVSSSADINLSSNRGDSWFMAHPKGSMDSGES